MDFGVWLGFFLPGVAEWSLIMVNTTALLWRKKRNF